jgi:hypothetical protein
MSGDAREEEQLALISQQIAEGTFRKVHLADALKRATGNLVSSSSGQARRTL